MSDTLKIIFRVAIVTLTAIVIVVSAGMVYELYIKHTHEWGYSTDGSTHFALCTTCGESTATHYNMITITKPATCAEDGIKLHYCEECDFSQEEIINKSYQHDIESVITKEPTCTENGKEIQTCKVCKKTTEITLAKKSFHVFTDGRCEFCGILQSETE